MLKPYCIQGVLEAGCDEAGRGPLAGSVFAAAVILPPSIDSIVAIGAIDAIDAIEPIDLWSRLNDSKQLTEKDRYALRPLIEQYALAWAVAEVTAEEIDRINILNASILGMHRALDKVCQQLVAPKGETLRKGLSHILVDGNKWKPYVPEGGVLEIPAQTVVHGDATYMSIAAASILAKTYRDDYMLRLHEQYPMYHWDENKGYPTKAHYEALRQYGPSPFHRQTFRLK